ncbi:NUDIX hydrolase [Clostridium sp. MCC353]|uniref:NUDIX hydrolase n=1 Tax=Clostridium sp. MCC353 TaxID=2592646 RepID=UPI001C00CDA5|nr:NUDIX hydrolase [Clostridium sp. MCC353]
MIPGGWIEKNETPMECCIREVAEETGLVVKPERCFLVINEYYKDWRYVNYYFECVVTGTTDRKPTEREIQVGAAPEWIVFDEAKEHLTSCGINAKLVCSSMESKCDIPKGYFDFV